MAKRNGRAGKLSRQQRALKRATAQIQSLQAHLDKVPDTIYYREQRRNLSVMIRSYETEVGNLNRKGVTA